MSLRKQIVRVRWIDRDVRASQTLKQALDWAGEERLLDTVGWLVYDGEDAIVIAQSRGDNDSLYGSVKILRTLIKTIDVVNEIEPNK